MAVPSNPTVKNLGNDANDVFSLKSGAIKSAPDRSRGPRGWRLVARQLGVARDAADWFPLGLLGAGIE
jgi:hypothetical protein